jgi:hypothetical protein
MKKTKFIAFVLASLLIFSVVPIHIYLKTPQNPELAGPDDSTQVVLNNFSIMTNYKPVYARACLP